MSAGVQAQRGLRRATTKVFLLFGIAWNTSPPKSRNLVADLQLRVKYCKAMKSYPVISSPAKYVAALIHLGPEPWCASCALCALCLVRYGQRCLCQSIGQLAVHPTTADLGGALYLCFTNLHQSSPYWGVHPLPKKTSKHKVELLPMSNRLTWSCSCVAYLTVCQAFPEVPEVPDVPEETSVSHMSSVRSKAQCRSDAVVSYRSCYPWRWQQCLDLHRYHCKVDSVKCKKRDQLSEVSSITEIDEALAIPLPALVRTFDQTWGRNEQCEENVKKSIWWSFLKHFRDATCTFTSLYLSADIWYVILIRFMWILSTTPSISAMVCMA